MEALGSESKMFELVLFRRLNLYIIDAKNMKIWLILTKYGIYRKLSILATLSKFDIRVELVAQLEMKRKYFEAKIEGFEWEKSRLRELLSNLLSIYIKKLELSCFWSIMEFFKNCRNWQTWPLSANMATSDILRVLVAIWLWFRI